jgi:hypothetical protein
VLFQAIDIARSMLSHVVEVIFICNFCNFGVLLPLIKVKICSVAVARPILIVDLVIFYFEEFFEIIS